MQMRAWLRRRRIRLHHRRKMQQVLPIWNLLPSWQMYLPYWLLVRRGKPQMHWLQRMQGQQEGWEPTQLPSWCHLREHHRRFQVYLQKRLLRWRCHVPRKWRRRKRVQQQWWCKLLLQSSRASWKVNLIYRSALFKHKFSAFSNYVGTNIDVYTNLGDGMCSLMGFEWGNLNKLMKKMQWTTNPTLNQKYTEALLTGKHLKIFGETNPFSRIPVPWTGCSRPNTGQVWFDQGRSRSVQTPVLPPRQQEVITAFPTNTKITINSDVNWSNDSARSTRKLPPTVTPLGRRNTAIWSTTWSPTTKPAVMVPLARKLFTCHKTVPNRPRLGLPVHLSHFTNLIKSLLKLPSIFYCCVQIYRSKWFVWWEERKKNQERKKQGCKLIRKIRESGVGCCPGCCCGCWCNPRGFRSYRRCSSCRFRCRIRCCR